MPEIAKVVSRIGKWYGCVSEPIIINVSGVNTTINPSYFDVHQGYKVLTQSHIRIILHLHDVQRDRFWLGNNIDSCMQVWSGYHPNWSEFTWQISSFLGEYPNVPFRHHFSPNELSSNTCHAQTYWKGFSQSYFWRSIINHRWWFTTRPTDNMCPQRNPQLDGAPTTPLLSHRLHRRARLHHVAGAQLDNSKVFQIRSVKNWWFV